MAARSAETLAIVGASGHGKVVADAAMLAGWSELAFFDDAFPGKSELEHWPVRGTVADLHESDPDVIDFVEFIVAIGDNPTRLAIQNRLQQNGRTAAIVAHPQATISSHATLEAGTVVMAGAVVNAFAQIGAACIVNTLASVDHDCRLAAGVHISPGAHLGGGVRVGKRSWIGIGASIKQSVNIADDITIGAGAVVVHDLAEPGVYVGCPARRLH